MKTHWLLLLALLALLNACAVFDKATPGWYESRQQFPTVEGIHLHYKEYGRGDPILFIHGFGESIYTWRHLLAPLATHHRVIALDLKGGSVPNLLLIELFLKGIKWLEAHTNIVETLP